MTDSMATDIQFCVKDYSDSGPHIQECSYCEDGVLYYPSVEPSDIRGNMDTFRVTCRCTECNEYTSHENTAPRYLTWRLVVRR